MNQYFYSIALMCFGAESSTDFLQNYSLKYHQRGFRNFFQILEQVSAWRTKRNSSSTNQINIFMKSKIPSRLRSSIVQMDGKKIILDSLRLKRINLDNLMLPNWTRRAPVFSPVWPFLRNRWYLEIIRLHLMTVQSLLHTSHSYLLTYCGLNQSKNQ